MTIATLDVTMVLPARSRWWDWTRRNPTIVIGCTILMFFFVVALIAPWLAGDPLGFDPLNRLKGPSADFWFGTDQFGRDVYNRVIYGTHAAAFLKDLAALIENDPESLAL